LKSRIKKFGLHSLVLLILSACATVPFTERKQLILIDSQTELALGFEARQEILKKTKTCKDPQIVNMVNKIGWRIAKATGRTDLPWEFTVIEDSKTANAFCLPGGKVFVYTGILKYTQNENGLSTVLAHEVGHVIARHGAERLSIVLLAQVGEGALAVALEKSSDMRSKAFLAAYGLGAQLGVILPYSRIQEYEADHLGLIFMAKAGYDPRGALLFWNRMLEKQKGHETLEFLSDHPTDEKRIETIKQLLPEALKYYHPNHSDSKNAL
jgi:predicted Zn-dependent protease